MHIEGWNVLDEQGLVLWNEYSFAKGAYATTLVFRGTDGLVVVSPGKDVDPRALDALAAHGEVKALVANNAYHHLGQPAWRARFPNAVSYAPDESVPSLRKKHPGIDFRPLGDLPLPAGVQAASMPGFRSGEAFFSLHTGKGTVWYSGDLLTNIHRTPGPPVKWLFTWTDSAPGFRLFKPCVWAFVKDRKALKAWMLDRLAQDPPRMVVPAHGPAFTDGDVAGLARAQLDKL